MQDSGSSLNSFTSRKFLVAIGSLVSATILCWNHMIADGVYSVVMIATVGAYLTANVAQKNITKAP